MNNSSFTGNSGVYTGGIYNYSQATVTNSTFGDTGAGAGNQSSGDGNGNPDAGALVNSTDSSPAQATVTNSTFTNNSGSMSGAIANADGDRDGATLQVGYSTFADNSSSGDANGPDAGAIVSMWSAMTEVANSTFFNNSSTSHSGAGALVNFAGAAFEIYGATITGNSGYGGGIVAEPDTRTNLARHGDSVTDRDAGSGHDNPERESGGELYATHRIGRDHAFHLSRSARASHRFEHVREHRRN